MADEEEKPAEAKEGSGGSSNKGLVVVVLIAAVVLGGGAAAAGAVVAMRMGAPAPAAHEEEKEHKPHAIVELSPIVVDIRSAADGSTHHLKVALSAEMAGEGGEGEGAKEEMAMVMPRGREAAISYLRSLTYEEVTSPGSFEKIKAELGKRIIEALGEKQVVGVLVTDFVTQ